jgi:hypothetical protein
MLRFSLLTLLGVVLVAAIGSAALANPSDAWRRVVVTGAVLVLLVATLFMVSRRPLRYRTAPSRAGKPRARVQKCGMSFQADEKTVGAFNGRKMGSVDLASRRTRLQFLWYTRQDFLRRAILRPARKAETQATQGS